MNLVDLVKRSESIVTESNVGDEYRSTAFKTVLEFLLSNSDPSIDTHLTASSHVRSTPSTVVENGDYEALLAEKQPKNDYEIVACIVYHLTGGIVSNTVSRVELLDYIRQNPGNLKGLKNLNGVIKHARGNPYYGYIENVKDAEEPSFRLSARGKQLVDRLPGREVKKRFKTTTKN